MKMFCRQFRVYKAVKVALVFVLVFVFGILLKDREEFEEQSYERVLRNRDKVYPSALSNEKKDWHDWAFIEYEKSRVGPGEQGLPYELTDEADIKLNAELLKVEGLYALVSDKISVNRSVPDFRNPK